MYPLKVTSYALISLAYISGLPEKFLLSTWTKISSCMQTNTYQEILVTDGTTSYTVFIYLMGWSGYASIGYYAVGKFSQNHLLANSASANTIACVNLSTSVWSNVVYQLSFVCISI